MAAVVELLVPCRPIVVEVRLGSEEALTPLEIGFVEAIAAGEHDFARLARMFGIGRRLALDLVFDLWQAQLLLVDTTQRRLDLADDIAEAVRRDGIEALRDARIGREQTRQLMQEQLTGHVLSARHHRSGVVIQQLVVPASEPPSAQDITETDLIAALRDDIAHDDTLRSARRVLSARLALRAAPRGGRSFWLQIRVEASVADATEDIDLAVLHHEALPHLTRMAMAQRIVAAVEQALIPHFITFVLPIFTLIPLASRLTFHFSRFSINSFSDTADVTKSSANNNSYGSPSLNFRDSASITIMKSSRLRYVVVNICGCVCGCEKIVLVG